MSKRLGAVLFGLGIVVLVTHTVVLFAWWTLLKVPYPLYATSGPLYWASGITPMLGPLLMVTGSMVYGIRPQAVDR